MSFVSCCLLWDLWGRHGRNKTSQKLTQIKAYFRFISIVYLNVKKKVEFPEPLFLIFSSPDFNKLIDLLR